MINNWISPGREWWDFIHSLPSNRLLHVEFLTCLPINVLLFMCLINGQCSFIKPLNYIWNWKTTAACAMLHCWGCQADINQLNGSQWDRLGPLDQIRLFFILLSSCLSGNIASQVFLLTQNSLWINFAVNSLCCSAPACLLRGCDCPVAGPPPRWSVGSHSMCLFVEDLLFCIPTIRGHTYTQDDDKLTKAHMFISLAHVWRGSHPSQFHRVLFWIKSIYSQHHLNSKYLLGCRSHTGLER